MDITVSALLILLLAGPMLLLALCILLVMGRPVLFVQSRVGRGAKAFRFYKFRTMSDARAPDGRLLPDAQRTGRFGRFIRNTSLDELPQLWNVLKGDMSLVGPRPLLVEYLPLYDERQARRHDVRPGITGLAQVFGRNDVTWEQRFELDVIYVRTHTFWMDIRILCRTTGVVFTQRGAEDADGKTMAPFHGNDPQ
ncbi:MAG: sugar transferase [Opitutales bacterium]